MILLFRRFVCKIVGHDFSEVARYGDMIEDEKYETWHHCNRCGWENN